jgi:hypothetical protein
LAAASFAVSAFAQDKPARAAAPTPLAELFRGDRRLAVLVDVAEKDRPLGELLGALGRKIGVPLVTDRATGDQKVTVYEDRAPAGELLTRIARHLELGWIKGKTGYVLIEPEAARGRRDRQRQEEWQGIQRWMERLAGVADLPEDAVGARQREAERGLKAPDLTPERRQELEEELALMADLRRHSRAVPVAIRIYRSLNPVQIQALRTNGFLRLSSGHQSLSRQVVAATHEALKSYSANADQIQEHERHADITFTLEEGARDRERPNGARQFRLYVELVAVLPDRSTSMLNWRPRSPAVRESRPAEAAAKDDPELARPLDLKLVPHVPPTVREAGATGYLLNQWPDSVTLGEVCDLVHSATGLAVVADSFTRARLTPAKLKSLKTVGDLLDMVARELDYGWTRDGKRLLLQSTTRAYDRAAEVPERVLQPFRKRMSARPEPVLDDYAALSVALTDAQCRGLTDFWGYYLEGTGLSPLWTSGGLFEARHQLRLWASLTAAQRQRALEMLTIDDMTPLQSKALALALSAPGDDLSRPDCLRIPTPESLPGLRGGFKVKQREVEVQAFQDDKGNLTATIATVGAGRIGGFGRFGPPTTPLGPKSRMPALDFEFYLLDPQAPPKYVRSTNYHVVPRYAP